MGLFKTKLTPIVQENLEVKGFEIKELHFPYDAGMIRFYVCNTCGAVVGDTTQHSEWHHLRGGPDLSKIAQDSKSGKG